MVIVFFISQGMLFGQHTAFCTTGHVLKALFEPEMAEYQITDRDLREETKPGSKWDKQFKGAVCDVCILTLMFLFFFF